MLSEGQELPRMELLWADGAYTGGFREWLRRQLGWRMEVPHHRDKQLWRYGLEEKPRGFQVLPRRWVVERTFAWVGLSRRLSKDYERLPETAETMDLRRDESPYAAAAIGACGVKTSTVRMSGIRRLQNSL
jgi:transposase